MPVVEFRIHDVVRLRKPHPCGGFEWQIYRLGADIGLRCQTCGHHVLLPRSVLEKRLKRFISRGPDIPLSLFFPGLPLDEVSPGDGESGGSSAGGEQQASDAVDAATELPRATETA